MRSFKKNRFSGFTLTEVIVALGIFTLVIAGGLTGVRRGFDLLQESRNHTRVSQILQSEMETLRTLSWENLTALPTNTTINVDTQFDTDAYDIYTVHRLIVPIEEDLRRVSVVISYVNKRGQEIAFEYVTFFTKGGVNDYYYRTI